MSVNSTNGNYKNYSTYLDSKYGAQATQKTEPNTGENSKATEAVEKPVETDSFVPSTNYKMDADKVLSMKDSLWHKVDAFEKMVNALFQKQGIAYNAAEGMRANLEKLIAEGGVSEADRAAAQAAIAEDGEWGVEQTATRILDFAKALSGGDPSKIGMLKDAVIKGFKEAGAVWGGELPEICGKTYDRIMEGFDAWEKAAAGESEA
ncbi:hypothetical protein LJC20_01620 [Eubacteriales bacterium OttesenSCG-928-M02]|nr:hypothetical protein [Eubacteriales bacterium OttesenSCG-928-M02]